MNNSKKATVLIITVIAGISITGCNWLVPQHTITVSSGPHGEISPEREVVVMDGESRKFCIKPDNGWYILDVLVDGNSIGALSSYRFVNVIEDHEIHAIFTDIMNISGYWSGPVILNGDEGYALEADVTRDNINIGGNAALYYHGELLSTYTVELTINNLSIEGMLYGTDMSGNDIEVSAVVNSSGINLTGDIFIPGDDAEGTFSIKKNYYYIWELHHFDKN
jgi:hypothetical protein